MSEGQGEAKSQVCEAARKGDTAKLRALIDSGADVSFFDGEGLNPLMHAARLGHADVVKILLETGVPWNALFPSNLSASNFAMDSGHQEAFEVLYKFFLGHLFPFCIFLTAFSLSHPFFFGFLSLHPNTLFLPSSSSSFPFSISFPFSYFFLT